MFRDSTDFLKNFFNKYNGTQNQQPLPMFTMFTSFCFTCSDLQLNKAPISPNAIKHFQIQSKFIFLTAVEMLCVMLFLLFILICLGSAIFRLQPYNSQHCPVISQVKSDAISCITSTVINNENGSYDNVSLTV